MMFCLLHYLSFFNFLVFFLKRFSTYGCRHPCLSTYLLCLHLLYFILGDGVRGCTRGDCISLQHNQCPDNRACYDSTCIGEYYKFHLMKCLNCCITAEKIILKCAFQNVTISYKKLGIIFLKS